MQHKNAAKQDGNVVLLLKSSKYYPKEVAIYFLNVYIGNQCPDQKEMNDDLKVQYSVSIVNTLHSYFSMLSGLELLE